MCTFGELLCVWFQTLVKSLLYVKLPRESRLVVILGINSKSSSSSNNKALHKAHFSARLIALRASIRAGATRKHRTFGTMITMAIESTRKTIYNNSRRSSTINSDQKTTRKAD